MPGGRVVLRLAGRVSRPARFRAWPSPQRCGSPRRLARCSNCARAPARSTARRSSAPKPRLARAGGRPRAHTCGPRTASRCRTGDGPGRRPRRLPEGRWVCDQRRVVEGPCERPVGAVRREQSAAGRQPQERAELSCGGRGGGETRAQHREGAAAVRELPADLRVGLEDSVDQKGYEARVVSNGYSAMKPGTDRSGFSSAAMEAGWTITHARRSLSSERSSSKAGSPG